MNIRREEKRLQGYLEHAKEQSRSAVENAVKAGEILLAIKEQKRGDFQDWVDEFGHLNYRQASKYMRVATHKWEALEHAGKSLDELQKVLPKTKEKPRRTRADAEKLGYVGTVPRATPTTGSSDMWNTPTIYVEAARSVMGGIDLDPFSSPAANQRVKAQDYMTEIENGFEAANWPQVDSVWMNPPYSRGAAGKAVSALLSNIESGRVKRAIVLMNASTDSAWFHQLLAQCDALCLTKGRIAFLGPDGEPSKGNTKGQVFFYFGENADLFRDVFSAYGGAL